MANPWGITPKPGHRLVPSSPANAAGGQDEEARLQGQRSTAWAGPDRITTNIAVPAKSAVVLCEYNSTRIGLQIDNLATSQGRVAVGGPNVSFPIGITQPGAGKILSPGDPAMTEDATTAPARTWAIAEPGRVALVCVTEFTQAPETLQ